MVTINMTDADYGRYETRGFYYEQSGVENTAISVTINTGTFGNWSISYPGTWNGIENCISSAMSGANGQTITITPSQDQSHYAVYFIAGSRQSLLTGSISRQTVPTPTYGLEVYNASGVKIISPQSLLIRFADSGALAGPLASGATSSPIYVQGMLNDNSWDIIIPIINSVQTDDVTLNRVTVTKDTGFFTITNNTSGALSNIVYWVLRA